MRSKLKANVSSLKGSRKATMFEKTLTPPSGNTTPQLGQDYSAESFGLPIKSCENTTTTTPSATVNNLSSIQE